MNTSMIRIVAAKDGRRDASAAGDVERHAVRDRLLQAGIAGSAISALCCFTPVLVWLLAALGLSAWGGYLDSVLLPALAVFLAITGYAIWRRRRHR